MSKIITSKSKISRKYGVSIWGKPNDAFNKKPYIPGQHGGKVMRVMKTYRKQLVEKNKLRFYHLLTEKQFSNIVRSSIDARSNSIDTLLQTLNTLLSTVLYSSGLFNSIFFCKQLVSHGHVYINGKKVSSHTYKVKTGDIITLSPKVLANKQILSYLENHTPTPPSYLSVDQAKLTIEVKALPESSSIKYPSEFHPNIVIEYYSA